MIDLKDSREMSGNENFWKKNSLAIVKSRRIISLFNKLVLKIRKPR